MEEENTVGIVFSLERCLLMRDTLSASTYYTKGFFIKKESDFSPCPSLPERN
jgi:hypothetical protein